MGERRKPVIVPEEMARFIGERRREDLDTLTGEFGIARELLKKKGDGVIWNAFRQTQRYLKNEVRGQVKFGLHVPRLSLRSSAIQVKGEYVVPTLSLRWDIQRGVLGDQKEVNCSILQAGGEITDLVFWNGGEHVARIEPSAIYDFDEVVRSISGQMVSAEDHLRTDKKTWRFESELGHALSTKELFDTVEEHQLHFVYI